MSNCLHLMLQIPVHNELFPSGNFNTLVKSHNKIEYTRITL